jgi:hypothetical protein
MIGLPDTNITRAYSFTSGPGDDYLEFYSIKVEDGPLTSELQQLALALHRSLAYCVIPAHMIVLKIYMLLGVCALKKN